MTLEDWSSFVQATKGILPKCSTAVAALHGNPLGITAILRTQWTIRDGPLIVQLQSEISQMHKSVTDGCMAVKSDWEKRMQDMATKCETKTKITSMHSNKAEITDFKNIRTSARQAQSVCGKVMGILDILNAESSKPVRALMDATQTLVDEMEGLVYVWAINQVVESPKIHHATKGKALRDKLRSLVNAHIQGPHACQAAKALVKERMHKQINEILAGDVEQTDAEKQDGDEAGDDPEGDEAGEGAPAEAARSRKGGATAKQHKPEKRKGPAPSSTKLKKQKR